MSKTKILVVEDEPIVRKICEAVLRNRGFDPIMTTNGIEGLAAYTERHEEICLVLSDVTMPHMGGIEMVRKIFEIHSHPNVIMMSGYNLSDLIPDDVRRLCSVIEKPFTSQRLVEAIKKCLKYEEQNHPPAAF
jgi:two-component system, cell cycle sensor histidine kinase and response regulator CckA